MADHGKRETTGFEIAVIGLAGRFPGARDPEALWRNLDAGVESIRFYDADELRAAGADQAMIDDPAHVPAKPELADVDRFDAGFFGINPREAEVLDPQQRFFLETATQALIDAGHGGDAGPAGGGAGGGSVGVYGGTGLSQYLLRNLASRPEVLAAVGELPVVLGNDKDYLATRLAYELDLEGPAVSVQTACSTSLVAVHLACQALNDGECDLALAGGVSIALQPVPGYHYSKDGILSPDGHCRPFDREARGTVFGSGVGVVALRRLADAITDGDRIRGVILGSAINNDGGAKVGFTAPRVEGQARVIRAALEAAEVDPASIGYVEAHGTATPLGDPIELAALRRAYGDPASAAEAGSCRIGSIKSNVGHLDTAAGVAGLIKALLALEHRRIPESLHYREPNPEIDFAASRFRVAAEATPWETKGEPRRAGVSSFGIGGTNAHLLLEEAPPRAPSGPSRPLQLLTLSAASESALEASTDALAEQLESGDSPGSEEPLADIAYTLTVGRPRRAFGRALVAASRADAARALRHRDPGVLIDHVEEAPKRAPVFLFPGQGSQWLGMGRELYAAEPVFRRELDRCREILGDSLGIDLRRLLWGDGDDSTGEDLEKATARLRRTRFAQPALFAVELAMARTWMAWGVMPEALVGHSLGEWVAATLAGVFRPEDALSLVAERGERMDACPTGAMLSVSLGEVELLERLPRALSPAAVNGPRMTVVSGPDEAIDAFAADLAKAAPAEQGVETRRLHTSHAFHSASMNPVVGVFEQAVARLELSPPKIPILANGSGTWMTDAEATDPGYWARQLRRPVRFGDALGELFRDPGRVLLEVGPGRALSSLAIGHPGRPGELAVVACGRPPKAEDKPGEGGELETFYRAAGKLWLLGAGIEPRKLFAGERRSRVALPAYPFDRTRFWIDPAEEPDATTLAGPSPEEGAEQGEATVAGPESDTAAEAVGETHPRPAFGRVFVAPRNETEEAVAAVWRQALGLAEVGVHDDFLELGGHSLLATRVAARLEERLAVEMSVRDLFEAPTVAGLAVRVEERRTAVSRGTGSQVLPTSERWPRIEPDPGAAGEPFPATEVQQAYWIGRGASFELGNVATHMYTELEGVGLDLDRLEAAWRRLVERHGMLRAEFLPDGRQRILGWVPAYRFERLDLRSASPEEAEAGVEGVRREMSHQVLPAERWPLFEIRATRLTGDRLRLHVSFDFLIGDAWSIELLTGEWLRLYQSPDTVLDPLELSFRDYVLAEDSLRESAAYERDLDYWRRRLDTLPGGPQLPLRQDPESLEAPTFTRRSGRLDTETWSRLQARATAAKLTPSALLLAAFSEVLGRFSKSRHFLLTLTLFRRLPLHPEVDQIVGDFTSLTLLEVEGSAETFTDRARAIQKRLIDDLDHRLVSGVRVLREAARRRGGEQLQAPVVFTSLLGLAGGDASDAEDVEPGEENAAAAAARLGAELELEQVYSVSQTPQVWIDHQVSDAEGELVWSWDAVDELFPGGLLDALFDTYVRLLHTLAGDGAAEISGTSDLPADPLELPADQLARRLLPEPAEPPPELLLHQLFERRALADPVAPAVIDGERRVTYGALLGLARRVGEDLVARGARRNMLVAVVMEKGWEQAAAVLSIHYAGAAYLPIDPALPAARIEHLLRRGEARLLLTQERLDGALEWPVEVDRLTLGVADLEAAMEIGGEGGNGGDGRELEPSEPLQGPGDLAYVIFTSGSTGEPKGVMIDHRGAANTVLDVNRRYAVGPGDRVLALSGLGFDLSVYDLFGLFAAGGAVVIPEPGSERRPDRWLELLEGHDVTLWNTVPALMTMLVESLEGMGEAQLPTPRLPEGLRLVMMSGDWIPVTLPDRLRRLALAKLEIISMGGATEASIWSILFPIGEVDPEWPSIPYGRAMDHQSFHVLDEVLEPCPDHVPGQLYIGGVGVALGYWRDPERTAASFIEHPRSGERLYRTGDLGRWRGDGTIEFLGREDFQVKVQGHRIELGEIEAALLDHPRVVAAVALAVGDRDRKRLVAVLQGADGPPTPRVDEEALSRAVRQHLEERLPAYMVPPRFLWLAALPLTANGKVDRKALEGLATEAGPASATTSVTTDTVGGSASPALDLLAELWGQVLGIETVAPGDNFFALGGDSILAIQVVSRANQQGLVLTPDQVFVHPTLGELAASVEPTAEMTAGSAVDSTAPVVGPVPLTPIQHWFFEHGFSRPGHWNQATVLGLGRRIEGRDLRRAVGALMEHHDALRLRFAASGMAGFRQWNAPPGDPPPVVEIDLSALGGPAGEALDAVALETVARRAATTLQGSLDLLRGPLFRIALLRVPEGEDQLLLIFHHLVVDGVSWRILLEDLERSLGALGQGRPIALAPKTSAFKTWAEALEADAWEGRHRPALATLLPPADLPIVELPTDFEAPVEANTEASLESVDLALGTDLTDRLLRFAPRHHRARIQEVLLAALTLALGRLAGRRDASLDDGRGSLAIDLETHGRDAAGDRRDAAGSRLDVSRTVGWLTAVYPLWVELDPGMDSGAGADVDTARRAVEVLRRTKMTLRRLDPLGSSYGVLRYLDPDPTVQNTLGETPPAAVSFNYLGRFDQVTAPESVFSGGRFETGPWNAPELRRRHALFVHGMVEAREEDEAELRLGLAYSRALHRRETVEALAADLRQALEALLEPSSPPAWVADDFPLARLGDQELAPALAPWARQPGVAVADVYPLAPLQEGLLFHGLYGAGQGEGESSEDLYVTTFACTLDDLDPGAFEAAWGEALERHPVLRTAFLWQGVERPHQVVLDGVTLPFRHEDWSGLDEAEQGRRLGRSMSEEAARVGDPGRAPLLAAALVRLDTRRHRFVLAHHHLVLDGWSLPLLLGDVFALYAERLGGGGVAAPPPPYRDYIAWLAEQDGAAAIEHWRGVLAGFDSPTTLAFDRGRVGTPATVADHANRRLEPDLVEGLDRSLRPYGLTRGTVVQGAWALLLAHHGDADDVVYGLSVAGRPPTLPGVETMLGVFTNTLPMRAGRRGDSPAHRWLGELQEQQVALRRFEHSPLAEAQKASDVPPGLPLFESLVVFENYPAPSGDGDGGLEPYDIDARLETNYPLLASANPGPEGLALDLAYDPARYPRTDIERLMSTWVRLLAALAHDPTRPLAELPWLDEAERRQLLVEWADGGAPRRLEDGDEWIERGDVVARILQLARRQPGRPALVTPEGVVTSYGALAEAVETLRDHLWAHGIGGEDLVAVHLRRSPGAIVALLSVLAAGAGYLPLDPELPRERRDFLLDDAAPRLLLTATGDSLAGASAETLGEGLPILVLDPTSGALDPESAAPSVPPTPIPRRDLGPDSTAYLIYTSGSTGRPKAVVIPRGALAAYVGSAIHGYGLGAEDRVMLFASLSFDASAEEIFPTLARGATLVLRADALPGTAADFLGDVERLGVSVLGLPTAYFHHLARGWVDEALPTPGALRLVIVGGEALRVGPTAAWRRHVPGVRLANTYGPTEATIVATRYDVAPEGDPTVPSPVPIGQPIEGVRTLVLDRHLRPVPIHGLGELCLAGAGLARGYLGRPATTAEVFVPSPDGVGERLYRTGDLARFRPGGQLEIAGRRDRQVKVRGFRVELGELEVALERHPAIGVAVVVVGDHTAADHLRLAAFFEPRPGAETPDGAALRDFLAASLPAALLPATFDALERLPRTVSGKVDRRALPTPGGGLAMGGSDPGAEDYRVPRDERERLVAETWGAVLGHGTVGVDDDFFQLGGDSILSIQVVSRLLRAGLRVSPQQIFEQRTVEALARVATPAGATTAPQGPVEGESPLLPIQRRFLERRPVDPHHFNQALLLATREPLEPTHLARALATLGHHHDALRLRFHDTVGGWRAEHAEVNSGGVDSGGVWPLTVVDLGALDELDDRARPTLERAAARVQEGFDLARGPLARAVLFRGGRADGDDGEGEPRDRLLLVVHHLVVDGVSWRILLEDLELALRQPGSGTGRLALPPKTTPFSHWAARVAEANQDVKVATARGALRATLATTRPLLAASPADAGRVDAGLCGAAASRTVEVDAATTEALLREVPAVYGTGIDDALLAALALALGQRGAIRVDLERHGRSLGTGETGKTALVGGGAELDLTRTVGWFTRILPLVLETGGDPGTTLKETKEGLRRLVELGDTFDPDGDPDGDLDGDVANGGRSLPPADLLFNYLGQLDTSLPEDSLFAAASEATGSPASPRQQREHPIELNAAVSEGKLYLAWTFAGTAARQLVEDLCAAYPRAVAELVEHCRDPEAGGYTPSDFPLMDFDQGELDDLASDLADDLADDLSDELAAAFEGDGE